MEEMTLQQKMEEFLRRKKVQVLMPGNEVEGWGECSVCGYHSDKRYECFGQKLYRADGKMRRLPDIIKVGIICHTCLVDD